MTRRVAPVLVAALTSPRTRAARRWLVEGRRRLGRAPHRILYFHQVDDPYSQLAAQVLERLQAKYDVELVPLLVGPPPDAAAPERERLVAWSRRDAADVAPFLGLRFRDPGRQPPRELSMRATQMLAAAREGAAFAALAPRVGEALWADDGVALEGLARACAPADATATAGALSEGEARRRRLGHYLGAMFHYGGEWYWGVDRLHYLERRLDALGVRRPGAQAAPLVTPPLSGDGAIAPQAGRLTLEAYLSLRSPYSYVAMERLFRLPGRLPVDLVLRPVLPMVMRGLPVPREKRLYIVLDTQREAEAAGVPFGRVCDPLGRPVERGLALFPWARQRGRAAQLLHSFARAAFAQGIDAGTDAGLRRVVEGAGLPWSQARTRLGREGGWRDELEVNREALLALGLWGVPSFRLRGRAGEPDWTTWGQDRLWRLELEIRRRLAKGPRGGRSDQMGP